MTAHILLVSTLVHLAYSAVPDWLITNITTPTTLTLTQQGGLLLSNGLISREFIMVPDFTTIDYFSYEKQSSLLRAFSPEAVIQINGNVYEVGKVVTNSSRAFMNRSSHIERDEKAFHFIGYSIQQPKAPFPYRPKRGAPKNIIWPPKGLRLDVEFVAPDWFPDGDVRVTIHYEMYDGIPLLVKWLTITPDFTTDWVSSYGVLSVECLSVNNQWGSTEWQLNGESRDGMGWLYVETDQSHGTKVTWDIDQSQHLTPGSSEPHLNVSYSFYPNIPLKDSLFESFRVHELLIGSNDPERAALARHRMFRLLAPHTQENPIFFHMTNSTSEAVRGIIDQLAEVGFEMMIYSFGSGFNIESTNKTYINAIKADISYANSKGIEVGGYDLISLTRHTAEEWMAIDPKTGNSSGSACFASGWYDFLLQRFHQFIDYTGLSMVETDGPYGGYVCSSKNHSHHKGLEDSIYYQQRLQGDFFRQLREKEIYVNQPDNFFYQGGSKTGMGYDENQFSLPRWEDLSISRQTVYDNTFRRIPTVGWMFVPLVPYHAGGKDAMFEPLSEHLVEYEWALAQYLGAGVAACYRGFRVYDSPLTKKIVTKWVSFYKKYRDILTSDIIHVRRPDLQNIDSFMHVNPFLKNKALAMVFNPLDQGISTDLELPLYYSGLTDTALVSQEDGPMKKYLLDRFYSISVKVSLQAKGITWFLIQ